jgi:RNA polymerase sigma-70 factor (ECF subfamily)
VGAAEAGSSFSAEQFADLYDDLLRLANVVAPPGVDGADVLHDALAACLGRLQRRGGVEDPRSYLARAIINQARSRRRRWARRSAITDVGWGGERPPVDGAAGEDGSTALLDDLPPRQRACLYLRFVEDLSVEQTATLLGCGAGTVKSQTAKALTTLRRRAAREARMDDEVEVTER